MTDIPDEVMREAEAVTDAIGNALIEHLKSGNAAPATGLMPPIIARALMAERLAAESRGAARQIEADAKRAKYVGETFLLEMDDKPDWMDDATWGRAEATRHIFDAIRSQTTPH